MARLSLAGRLRPCDPEQAAEHFLALLTGPLEARSGLGTRRLPAAELRGPADAAVDTFLRAYGSERAAGTAARGGGESRPGACRPDPAAGCRRSPPAPVGGGAGRDGGWSVHPQTGG
ncbi:TetR/AcrR family transcriptional regulator C-terminal domain-containing protein [Streptomyces sp. NPDC006134]|uniref:TetR/AcrR family transcriptional regulator C-terminal domain-containing protein n=1 Tax=Streptomyces sp. NPDC006134 TaxID=3154467 RepID=UPI0033F66B3D